MGSSGHPWTAGTPQHTLGRSVGAAPAIFRVHSYIAMEFGANRTRMDCKRQEDRDGVLTAAAPPLQRTCLVTFAYVCIFQDLLRTRYT
jgi:hypothetical protein